MNKLRNSSVFAILIFAAFLFTQCSENKNKIFVDKMNKEILPIQASGVSIMKAEVLPNNTIKFCCLATDPIYENFAEKMIPSMKASMIAFLQSSEAIFNMFTSLNANILYEFETTSGKSFEVFISMEELKSLQGESLVSNHDGIPIILQTMYQSIKPQLPIVISPEDDMYMTDIYIEDNSTFVYVYEVPRGNIISVDENIMREILIEMVKENKSIENFILKGVNIKYVYRTPEKEDLVQVIIQKEDL